MVANVQCPDYFIFNPVDLQMECLSILEDPFLNALYISLGMYPMI